jgi:hypothetical protein
LFGICGGFEAEEYVDVGRDFADLFECERESVRERRERETELPRDGVVLECDVVGREEGIETGTMNVFSGGSGVLSGVAMFAGKRLKCCELRWAELLSNPYVASGLQYSSSVIGDVEDWLDIESKRPFPFLSTKHRRPLWKSFSTTIVSALMVPASTLMTKGWRHGRLAVMMEKF